MATEEAPKQASARLVNTILQQNSEHLDTVIKNIDTKDFYKVVNATPQYFVEVGKEKDTMLIDWTPEETAPIIFNKLELELDDGRRWFMFTVKDVMKIKKHMGKIGVLALPKEAKAATLDLATLNKATLDKLKQKMFDLHRLMSSITPEKDTYENLEQFRKELSKTVHNMGTMKYPEDIKAYVESAMVWVVAALVVAAEDNVTNAINHLDDSTKFYRNKQARLQDIRRKIDYIPDAYRLLDDAEREIYDNFRNPKIRSASDQDINDYLYRLEQIMEAAIKKKNDVKDILKDYFIDKQITHPPSVSVALNNVKYKIEAIGEDTNFDPSDLNTTIDALKLILSPNEPSTGGRRRTNKKRSTRRKKKRGKKRRSYRTKR